MSDLELMKMILGRFNKIIKLGDKELDYRKKTRTSRRKINDLLNAYQKFYTLTTHKVKQQANIASRKARQINMEKFETIVFDI